jgi:SulP family sulfate permease
MAIEVETKNDIDLDHELRLNGLANILAGLAGGTVGTLSVSRSLFSYRIGARGRISGILVGAVCLFPLALGPSALGFVPMPILGAVLIQLGGSMLYEWLFKSWRLMQPADYFQLFIIFLTIISFDFVAGVGVGIITACITFVVNTARIRLVKHAMNRGNFSSRVDRPIYQTETLQKNGARIQIMWLHGFVFFGSAHHLLSNIKSIILSSPQPCCSLILDFKQVLGIDSSAAMTLVKLRHLSEREGFHLVFSNLSENVTHSLRLGGVVTHEEDKTCRIFNNLDVALEWCEDNLLQDSDEGSLFSHTTSDWLKSELGATDRIDLLGKYIEIKKFDPGDKIFNQGEIADSLYILATGRVTISFKSPEGSELRLRSMLGHTLLGEMGLYRNALRGASVVVDEPTVVYKVTRQSLQRMEEEAPELAHAFHKFVVRTLAARLDFSNREVAGLQR